jgi:hypothetical protein
VSLRVHLSLLPQVRSDHDENNDGEVSPTTYGVSNLGHVRHGTHLRFFCVEIADGISGSESNDSVADNPTDAQSVRFHNDLASQEIFELQRLEDMGLCEPIDDS